MLYKNLFYFDIETVGQYKDIDSFKENDERGYLLFKKKYDSNPWMQEKDELIDYAMRSGVPVEVLENLREIEDEGEMYETIEDIWPDYPTKEDFFFHEDEY